ncbi:MAG: apolipoprotein N-acyltransferase [Phycisphaerales bacterium]|nr:MAG: apolipoprotein N-acyltransferase [Phycisphaerales bacterium]
MKKLNCLQPCLVFLVSAAILSVIQPPVGWACLAWVALVPFILACSPKTRPKSLALAAYAVSLAYWLVNLYWILPITIAGWVALCIYTALLWPILALGLRYCRTKGMPLFLAAAVLVVGTESLQGVFLGGFFWRFLGHSQYQNTTLIQIADIFGASGVSFLIAMVNGLIAELIIAAREKKILTVAKLVKTGLVCTAVVAAVVYGRWRIGQEDEFVEAGPLVASLQSNVPQSIKRSFKASNELFDDLLISSKASVQAGAELIVWPETMVQGFLDSDVWPFLKSPEKSEAYDKALREHAEQTAYVLVGAYGARIRQDGDYMSLDSYNSAFFYRPDGLRDLKRYDKIHLVLFGEYLPFRKSMPWLYDLLMKFTPYDTDYSLEPGRDYAVFEITDPVTDSKEDDSTAGDENETRRVFRFGTIICYEDTIPTIARKFALDEQGRKRIDWLVNISNDGWFVTFKDEPGRVVPSAELAQHAAICAFRAVENRLAIVRSVNTGVSCLIDSLGRIHDGYIAASRDFPAPAMKRQGMAGWFVDRMPIDRRVTFFSKCGQWLDFCCTAFTILLIIGPFAARFFGAKKCTTH